jgi:hypothetical protein
MSYVPAYVLCALRPVLTPILILDSLAPKASEFRLRLDVNDNGLKVRLRPRSHLHIPPTPDLSGLLVEGTEVFDTKELRDRAAKSRSRSPKKKMRAAEPGDDEFTDENQSPKMQILQLKL